MTALARTNRFYARSASDKADDWPFWFIADREQGGLNVTVRHVPALRGRMPFLSGQIAEAIAEALNEVAS